MTRYRSLRFLAVLMLSLVLTGGMVTPTLAESENDSIVVTGQVLPYLEVSLDKTTWALGELPSVWNPADFPDSSGWWNAESPFKMTVTSNLPYGTSVVGQNSSTGLVYNTHFLVYMDTGVISFGIFPGSPDDTGFSGGPALNRVHNFALGLYLKKEAMPIPPSTINFSAVFTVSQVI